MNIYIVHETVVAVSWTRILFNSHVGGPYDIETSSLICSANQWTGLYMIETAGLEELIKNKDFLKFDEWCFF